MEEKNVSITNEKAIWDIWNILHWPWPFIWIFSRSKTQRINGSSLSIP
jgi:hypothetical protein